MVPGVFDKVPHNEKIVHISHFLDNAQLIFQPFLKLIQVVCIPLFQSFIAQLIQVFPGSIGRGYIKFRQLCHTEPDFHIAAVRNLLGIGKSLQGIRKQFFHFLGGFYIVLAPFISHPVLILETLSCLDTQKDIMSLGVLCVGIMDIVSSNQIDSCLLAHTQKLLVHQFLLGQSMVLKLQKKVPFPKDFLIPEGGAFCLLIHTSCKISCNFSCKAGAQCNNSFVIFL